MLCIFTDVSVQLVWNRSLRVQRIESHSTDINLDNNSDSLTWEKHWVRRGIKPNVVKSRQDTARPRRIAKLWLSCKSEICLSNSPYWKFCNHLVAHGDCLGLLLSEFILLNWKRSLPLSFSAVSDAHRRVHIHTNTHTHASCLWQTEPFIMKPIASESQ